MKFLLLPLSLVLPLSAQTVIHVDRNAGGANDGTSWADAYPRLQDALAAAVAPAEIWVAGGSYRPNEDFVLPPDAPDDSFVITDGIAVYGGFDGLETLREQRDPVANPTILSGDLLGDDTDLGGGVWTGLSENSRHVLSIASGSPWIDGLTITAGNGAGEGGGGIIVAGGSPQFVNCTIRRNTSATHGGGVVAGGSPTFTDCSFLDNLATGSGGGVQIASGTATFSGCRFEENDAGASGGGLATAGATVHLDDCSFRMNDASSSGGAVFFDTTSGELTVDRCLFESNIASGSGGAIHSASSPGGTLLTLTDCRFIDNRATAALSDGGALYLSGINNRNVTIQSCEFTANQCGESGGAVFVLSGSGVGLLFEGCTFRGNSTSDSDGGGGALHLFHTASNAALATLRDCVFQGNRCGGGGGAVFLSGLSARSPGESLINCSFQGNDATGSGGALGGTTGSSGVLGTMNLHNCVVWNNRSAGSTSTAAASLGGFLFAGGDHNLLHNIAAAGSGSLDGTSVANDPLFAAPVDPATAPQDTGDLRPRPASPVLDAGENNHNTGPTDVAGAPRVANTTIDIGAHEAIPTAEVVVRRSGVGLSDGDTIDLGVIELEAGTVAEDFVVENAGLATLASLSVGAGGPDAASTVLDQPAGSLDAYQTATFSATVSLTTTGPLSLALSLASSDADENPFDLTLTGTVASAAVDSDMDGLSDFLEWTDNDPATDPGVADTDNDGVPDGAELDLAGLGFANGRDDGALLADIQANAPALGLYTESALQSLALGRPLLGRDPTSGNFTLKTGVVVSPDLSTPFIPLTGFTPSFDPGTGEILLEFSPPAEAAQFYQVFGQEP